MAEEPPKKPSRRSHSTQRPVPRDTARTSRPPRPRRDGKEAPPVRHDEREFEPRATRSSSFSPRDDRRNYPSRDKPPFQRPTRNSRQGGYGDYEPSRDALVYGVRACEATAHIRPKTLRRVFLQSRLRGRFRSALEMCRMANVPVKVVENDELERLTKSQHHGGVCFFTTPMHLWNLDEWVTSKFKNKRTFVLVLVGVDNPHNIGAILRVAAHFGAQAVFVTHPSHAVSASALRVAEGGAEYLELVHEPDPFKAINRLKDAGFAAVAAAPARGNDLFSTAMSDRTALVIGAEADGLSEELLHEMSSIVQIPGSGKIQSLNVATATAVCAAEWFREHGI